MFARRTRVRYRPAMPWRERLKLLAGVDARSLALFRVALGLVVLADLATRATALEAHYTDAGVLPREALVAWPFHPLHLSLHALSGELWFVAGVFGVHALAALAMVVGWRTRAATFVTWLLYCSLVSRNEMLLQGSDNVVRLLLFWALFLPLGLRASVDRARAPDAEVPAHVTTPATLAVQLQVGFIFWFTALLKTSPDWWPDGTAIYYALHWDDLATPFASVWLGLGEGFLQGLTWFVLVAEFLGPFIFFVPFAIGPLRTLGVALFLVLFLVFGLTFRLGVWPWAGVAAVTPFVPGWLWDRLARIRLPRVRLPRLARRAPAALPPSARSSRATHAVVVVALLYCFAWNVGTVAEHTWPAWLSAPGHLFRLDQRWNMFAPGPRHDGGWWVVHGRRADGVPVFLHPDGAARWEPPPVPADVYTGHRWRLYMWQYWFRLRDPYRPYLGRWLCRRHNEAAAPGERLQSLQVFYLSRRTLPGHLKAPARRIPVLAHVCEPH